MNQLFKVIIVEDEPPARDLLELYVSRMPDLVCTASCSNAMTGLEAIQTHKPDLLLLDIRMPEMTGVELISLPLNPRPDIILTTAYPEYALTSYDYSVLDYLVKPIGFERFAKSIFKFREKKQAMVPPTTSQPNTESPIVGDVDSIQASSIWLREEKRLVQIPYDSVLYVEALKDYVKVYLHNEMILSHVSIGKAEKLFSPPQFVRIHRSYIVQLAAIRQINGNAISLLSGKILQLGPLYRDELKKYIPALI